MARKKPVSKTTAKKLRLTRNQLILLTVLVLILIGAGVWRQQTHRAKSTATTKISCNAVSSISNPVIVPKDSETAGQVVIDYTLTTTRDTGLDCFLLATVKDADGTQVGTWRRSFYHTAPGTYHERHDLGQINYHPGETLEVKIIAAEGSSDYRD